jgi:anti-sigma regulatory factor (Ser/Thr protein kinase)
VPAVLMTSRGSEDVAVKALQRGAASYVPKRSLGQNLLETIGEVLELTGRERTQQRLMDCLESCSQQFVMGNYRYLLSSLVGHLQEIAAQLGVCDESDRVRIGIALEEALVNAFYHGNLEVSSELRESDYDAYQALLDARTRQEPYCNRKIYVQATMSRDRAEFVIRDEGPGFDPKLLPDPTDPANLERVSGRGVLLMRTFMDEVNFTEKGNQVTLIKNRSVADDGSPGDDDDSAD